MEHGRTLVLIFTTVAASAGQPAMSDAQRPACAQPAPLAGRPHPAAPGYIVYHDSVDALAETARLAGRYRVSPSSLYRQPPPGFTAELEPDVSRALQCEPTVKWVEHIALGCVGVAGPAVEVLVIDAATDSFGARGRPGTYTVHLSKAGYHDWVQPGIRARPGVCNVERAFVRAVLLPRQPAPRPRIRPEHRHP